MAYCAQTDVEAQFKSLAFTSGTNPTATQVAGFMAEADGEIDAKIGMKYQVPVAGAASLVVLKQIAVNLVAGRVKNILPVKTGSDESNQGKGGQGDTMIKWARDALEQIRKGEMLLSDATLYSTNDGVKSGNVDNAITATFARDTDQW